MNKSELKYLLTSPEAAAERAALSNERWKALVTAYLGMTYYDGMITRLEGAEHTDQVELRQSWIDSEIRRWSEIADPLMDQAEDPDISQAQRDRSLAKLKSIERKLEDLYQVQKIIVD